MTKTSEAKKEYTKTMAYLNSNRNDIENDTYTRLADKAWKKLNDAEARTARRAAKFAARQQEIKDMGLTFKTIGQTHRENMEAKETATTRSFQWDFSS